MILQRFGKRRQRLSGGSYRGQQTPQLDHRARRMRRMVLLLSFIFLVVGVTKRLSLTSEKKEYNLEGPVAQDTFVAEIGFKSKDLQKTQEAGDAAAAKVPDVFRVSQSVVEDQMNRLDEAVKTILDERPAVEKVVRKALESAGPDQAPSAVITKTVKTFAEGLEKQGGVFQAVGNPELLAAWLMPRLRQPQPLPAPAPETGADTSKPAKTEESKPDLKHLTLDFSNGDHIASLARQGLKSILEHGVMKADERGSEFSKNPERRITVLRGATDSGRYRAEDEITLSDVYTLDGAADALKAGIAKAAQDEHLGVQTSSGEAPVDVVKMQDAAYAVARQFLTGTLDFDSEETNIKREEARDHVEQEEPVMKEFMPTEEIVRKGQRWTPQSKSDVKTYLAEKQRYDKRTANVVSALAGHAILVALILFALVRALPLLVSKRQFGLRDLNLILLIMCVVVAVGRVTVYFDDTGLLVPVAAAAILLAILTNTRVASLSSVLIAILLSVQFDYSWRVLMVASAMSFTGVLSIFMVRRRSDMGGAAVKATFVGELVIIAASLAQDALFTEGSFKSLVLIALNGVLCLFLVPGLVPPLERLFGITTDIQLLEYSDLNNHILSRLAMEVPATYAHSLMLGQLAEAAADAVGANGLLARVSAYYHDIGKMRRPEYFSENQTGANIHDELSPRLSARAIASHVTEGAEMARELHLPKPLIDAIYEHHGTCLISFFYKEAVAQQKHGGVVESDFRYPGPRPRSRETAILMICDGVESGVRSLKNPNEERVREFIDRIISSRAADRQFDECDLTLRDLDTISDVLAKRIASSQHKRIAYPGQEKDKEPAVSNVIPLSGGQE